MSKITGLYMLLLAVAASFAVSTDISHAETPLKITAISNATIATTSVAVLKEVYERAGLQVSFEFLPAKRGIRVANSGLSDGEAIRSIRAVEGFPNLVRVDIPIGKDELVAYALNNLDHFAPQSDLSRYRIGILRGDRAAEKMAGNSEIHRFRKFEHAVEMLLRGRIDIAIGWQRNFEPVLAKRPDAKGIHRISHDLLHSVGYHFLHKKHRHLVGRLEKAIKELWASGRIDEIWRTGG